MKNLIAVACLVLLPCSALAEDSLEWPREYKNEKGKLVLYQPQVTEWKDFAVLDARMALAFAPAGADSPSLGAVAISAKTDTNREDNLVRIYDIKIEDGNFPTLDDPTSAKLMDAVLTVLPDEAIVELERITANLERFDSREDVQLKVDPPLIFASTQAAILVQLDGPPLMSPIEDNDLKSAVNTNWDLFQLDETWYLLHDEAWIAGQDLGGPWTPAGKLPKSFKKLSKKDANWKEVRSHVPGEKIQTDDVPVVYVSETPAELILIDSEPTFSKVKGARLLWVDNTDSDLFKSTETGMFYYLVSGRWFRAESLEGPWTFASHQLPEEFEKIPAEHPRSRVRASVSGTPEAKEASLQAQIPQKATVKRDAAKPEVAYSGEPDFQPIDGTSMHYAVNTPNDVIRAGDGYHLCYQGVWFTAATPHGPWFVTDSVPDEIYSIPPSSPVYHTTYVHVYHSTPTHVTVGYTSGYVGVYVAFGCAWYGTGWYYPPYSYWGPRYPVYYGYPYSYGVSAYYNPHTGSYGRGVYGYGPYGGWGSGARYNPTTGRYGRGGYAYGGYQSGRWAQAYNPRTGVSAGTYQRSTPYAQWGESVVRRGDSWARGGHYTDSRGTIGGIETSRGGRAVGGSGERGTGFVGRGADNNVYAGRDGNVYRRDEDGWSKHGKGGWEGVERPQRDAGQLERDRQARERGATRARDSGAWRSSGSSFGSRSGSRPSRGSVGGRGGGRGGGRRR